MKILSSRTYNNIVSEMENLKNDNNINNDMINRLEKEIDKKEKELKDKSKEFDKISSEFDAFKEETKITRLKAKKAVESLKKAKGGYTKKINQLENENQELKQKIADMQKDTEYFKIKKINPGSKPKAQTIRIGTRTKANQVQKELKEKADLRAEK